MVVIYYLGLVFLIIGSVTVPKKWLGIRVCLGASKYTLLSSALLFLVGVRASLGRRVWTPFGEASSLETLIGRWMGIAGLILTAMSVVIIN